VQAITRLCTYIRCPDIEQGARPNSMPLPAEEAITRRQRTDDQSVASRGRKNLRSRLFTAYNNRMQQQSV
jgi:hypothetical protein